MFLKTQNSTTISIRNTKKLLLLYKLEQFLPKKLFIKSNINWYNTNAIPNMNKALLDNAATGFKFNK